MKLIGVIPARYASTRMPGKPLADILGKPMIWWVYQEAKKCKKLDDVFIATDDERIAEACRTYGMEYCTLDFEYEKVTGIQLYSRRALAFYHETPKSILEKAEENDMMRFVENGHKVHAIVSPYKTVSVDTPKDLALVSEILKGKE